MNKEPGSNGFFRDIILVIIGAIVGAGLGFYGGYKLNEIQYDRAIKDALINKRTEIREKFNYLHLQGLQTISNYWRSTNEFREFARNKNTEMMKVRDQSADRAKRTIQEIFSQMNSLARKIDEHFEDEDKKWIIHNMVEINILWRNFLTMIHDQDLKEDKFNQQWNKSKEIALKIDVRIAKILKNMKSEYKPESLLKNFPLL